MSKNSNLVVSVVCLLHNYGEILEEFVAELSQALEEHYTYYEILLIDDGSTDSTAGIVEQLLRSFQKIRYLALSRWNGAEIAISAGLEAAIGDYVVIVDPATDPVSLIPELVERARKGPGLLCGVSAHPKHRGRISTLASQLFHAYCRRFLGFDYRENTTEFRVFSRQVVNALLRIKDRRRFMRVAVARLGYPVEFFSYPLLNRIPGAGVHGVLASIESALEIAISNSRHPLRLVSRLGLLMSLLNFLYVFYIAAVWIFKRRVAEGWTTASLQHTTMFFFIFLILAVLCEYIGRILEETQNRPLYFVAHEKVSDRSLEDSIQKNIVDQSEGRVI